MITFYLVCFLAGLMLSIVSLLGGMGHFGGHVHIPHAPHVHLPHAPHAHIPHGASGVRGAGSGSTVPWWNAFSVMVFLCWFGAAGYLLTSTARLLPGSCCCWPPFAASREERSSFSSSPACSCRTSTNSPRMKRRSWAPSGM